MLTTALDLHTPDQTAPARAGSRLMAARMLLGLMVLYAGFAAFYAGTIAYSVRGFQPNAFPDYLQRALLIDYPLKALWTLPVWWLLFRGPLRNLPEATRLWTHLLLGPLWVASWYWSYYGLLNLLGQGGIRGDGRVWDVYIPALFYGVQFGVLHGADFVQRLRRQSLVEQALREQAHHSAVSALKAQINPHFFFNTLNSISASVPPELESTRQLIAQLAHTFRFALAASHHEQLPLGQELAFLQDYLTLEQARFGARLQVQLEVDQELLNTPVPPMLVQPLVENAVRHGLAPSVAGGTITLQVERAEAASLRVTVADTGVGCLGPPAALLRGAGLGLRNTHARLLALGSAGLEVAANVPQGLRVSFVLPLPAATDTTLQP